MFNNIHITLCLFFFYRLLYSSISLVLSIHISPLTPRKCIIGNKVPTAKLLIDGYLYQNLPQQWTWASEF